MSIAVVKRSVVSLIVAAVLVATTALIAFSQGTGSGQPIAFNHKKHSENNVSCAVCHPFYAMAAKAGIPNVQVCRKCHEDVVYVSTEKTKLLNYIKRQVEIPWRQVNEVPQHVLFSHKRHVVAGKLECLKCHGNMSEIAFPLTEPSIKLTMDKCIECHKTVFKNPNECLACHR